ncbi:MAG: hypothetical protein IT553_07735 [Sphingomonadaceae bacterium]|nr:hypothetical protein [Sphingomonadaceae bacterium]
MSKSNDAQSAASHVLELLVQDDGSIETIIARVADDYALKVSAVEAWLMRSFPSLDSLADWREQRRVEARRVSEWRAELEAVQTAANEWAQWVWRNCEPDGEPSWDYCCDRFLEASAVQKEDLRLAARKIFSATGEKYEAARLRYVANKKINNAQN